MSTFFEKNVAPWSSRDLHLSPGVVETSTKVIITRQVQNGTQNILGRLICSVRLPLLLLGVPRSAPQSL